MLALHPEEQTWLDEYRRVLDERHPGTVLRMILYGSKARGDAREDSDLDVLLVIRDGTDHLKFSLREIGYELAVMSDAVPSILAYTREEWEERRRRGYPFQQAVEREGVSVL